MREFRGQTVLATWPKKRGRNIHPTTREQNLKFAEANYLAKYADAETQVLAREVTAGTPLLPRDLLVGAMYGRLWAIDVIGEGTLYSEAMVSDVSQNLDVIGQKPGDILARGISAWTRVPGSTAGRVLTSQGPTLPPVWAAPAGVGGLGAMTAIVNRANSGGATATKGWVFIPLIDMSVSALIIDHTEVNGATYKGTIFTTDGDDVDTVLAQTAEITGTANAAKRQALEFASPVPLTKGVEVVACTTRTDGTGTTVYTVAFDNAPKYPVAPTTGEFEISMASADPAATETFSRGSSGTPFCVNLIV